MDTSKYRADGSVPVDSTIEAATAILTKRGFHIGRDVKTTKRTTTNVVNDGATLKHDVPQNTKAVIVGIHGSSVLISTHVKIKDVLVPVEFAMNSDSLAMWDGAADGDKKITTDKTPRANPFDFVLGDSDHTEVNVRQGWHKYAQLESATALCDAKSKVSRVSVNMEYVKHVCPTYTDEDLMVVDRKGVSEVWTMRAFKPREIVVPCISSDIRTAYWTRGNAQSVPDHNKSKTQQKVFVIDGKSWGSLDKLDQPGRGYSLFWSFRRSVEKKEINLEITTLHVHETVTVEGVPTKAEKVRDYKMNPKDFGQPMIPCAFNPSAVAKHTQLFLPVDRELKSMEQSIAKDKADRELKLDMDAKRKHAADEKHDDHMLAEAAAEQKRRKKA